ncbi:hypothetical protein Bca4012_021369 [Brassica carinata]
MEVQEGFEKKLILGGVGYHETVERKPLVLNLGFSYPVKMQIPENLKASEPKERTELKTSRIVISLFVL